MIKNQNLQYSPYQLFELAHKTVSSFQDDSAHSFAASFPDISALSSCELKPAFLPLIDSVNSTGPTSDKTIELVNAIKNSYKSQAWRQPYSEKDIGGKFVNGSAWFPIADIDGPIIYTQGLVEIMLLGAGVTYPKHSHSPEELYIVLAGQVFWEADGSASSPTWKKSGETIHHLPNQTHSITAGEDAVLILSLWRGGSFEMPSID